MGLIGKEMFAVDGCKMPSFQKGASRGAGRRRNSSTKRKDGKSKEGLSTKEEKTIRQILTRHREMDIKEKTMG